MLLHSPGYQQVESSTGTSGRQCGQLKHQYKAGDDRMEKLLLTVWEAADVIGAVKGDAANPQDTSAASALTVERKAPTLRICPGRPSRQPPTHEEGRRS